MIKILNKEVEFNPYDVESFTKFEQGQELLIIASEKVKLIKNVKDEMMYQIEVVHQWLDLLFGEGFSNEIGLSKTDLVLNNKVFFETLEQVKAEMAKGEDEFAKYDLKKLVKEANV